MNPVCFGSVILIDPGTDTCMRCDDQRSCLIEAQARVERLPQVPDVVAQRMRLAGFSTGAAGQGARVSVSQRGIARRDLTPEDKRRLDHLPGRARTAAKKLLERDWFGTATRQLARGEPVTAPGNLGVALSYLTSTAGPTRYGLIEALQSHGLQLASARVEASNLVNVLEFGGLLQRSDGQLQLIPTMQRHYHVSERSRPAG